TPISARQRIEPLPDTDWERLHAWVPMDQETLWWVFGLGENVRVREPASWAQEIRARGATLLNLYAQQETPQFA
ncbi:MAG TPA: WYL domain-containing protein, partial [Pseudomonas sp.]|nr:WYL domain-containing protein [Pseudomonas sp.]